MSVWRSITARSIPVLSPIRPGRVTSAPVLLTVIRDTNPPTVSLLGNVGTANVQVVYLQDGRTGQRRQPGELCFTNGLPVTAASLVAG